MKETQPESVKIKKLIGGCTHPPIDDIFDDDVFTYSAQEQLSPEVKRLLENF